MTRQIESDRYNHASWADLSCWYKTRIENLERMVIRAEARGYSIADQMRVSIAWFRDARRVIAGLEA